MKVLKIIGNIILWVFIVLAAFLTIMVFVASGNKDGVPALFGKVPVVVLTDSMKPTFSSGDLIIDTEVSAADKAGMQEGDVITFYADLNNDGTDELNTHRVVGTRQTEGYVFYTTKGDNNAIDDTQEVRSDMVVGRFTGTKIGGLGAVIGFLQTPTGFLVCIVLPLIVFFIFELYNFIMAIVVRKNRKAQANMSAEQEEEIKKRAIEEYQKQLQEQASGSGNDTKPQS